MNLHLDIQNASKINKLPSSSQLKDWACCAITQHKEEAELSIRIVDEDEISELNQTYRNKSGPTNVLSFPADLPAHINLPLLGDLVICAPVVEDEAKQQLKPVMDHWAHMVIHGTLHLLGYDHSDDDKAEVMEALEIKILADLNIANPYQ